MARKGAKEWREHFVSTFYGINFKTFGVEGVTQLSGNTLSKWCGGAYEEHRIPAGADAKAEIERVYGLVDVVEVPAEQDSMASTIAILEGLHRKAVRRKKMWSVKRA